MKTRFSIENFYSEIYLQKRVVDKYGMEVLRELICIDSPISDIKRIVKACNGYLKETNNQIRE